MKIVLKTASHLFGMAFISFCFAVAAHGQGRNDLLISAHAGGVNFVSGDVAFKRAGESARRQLLLKDDLKSGDALTTGGRGQVEVLLNPGSYLRLGGNSEFELTDNSLDNLRLKLVKGSAVIEATGYGDLGPLMVVETPRSRVSIVRGGIYR
ncbi:MAG TPA: FecR domain-containing protein, partial [Pyrinomonadaceae bacterium]|nr:FecR domain-containing protein [Pyrinomonadaceae bacterium]